MAKVASTSSKADNPLNHLYNEVSKFLRPNQPGITSNYVRDQIANADQLVLVLDGIDEAGNLITWISDIIKKLRELKGEQFQVVASSRFSVPEIEEIGLFRIELLPFRRDQVIRFINSFLSKQTDLATEVVEHLKRHPGMYEVAQTPLMSTILCVLAQNGVVLPETKSALYQERFELLWGAYDTKKQVHRVKSSKACLEDVSKKSAYYLHSHGLRSFNRKDILHYLHETLTKKYRPDVISTAFAELERPCNVLLEKIDGTVGFGHLSYQEYLVSAELYTNRSSELAAHLTDPWWRGVLVLAAMKAEDIGVIIEQRIMDSGDIGAAAETLKAMIEVANVGQKKILGSLLRDHKKLDEWNDCHESSYFEDFN